MIIIANRSSVCMADDIDSHEKAYEIRDDFNARNLFNYLIKVSFFPGFHGDDVVWVMTFKEKEIASYQTKRNMFFNLFTSGIPMIIDLITNDEKLFDFYYFSSREKRLKYILEKYNYDEKLILNSELSEEYKSYSINKD